MDLDEVRGLVEQVRAAQTIEALDEAMHLLRSRFPGCAVVQSAAWGVVLIARINPYFEIKDLNRVRGVFDSVVVKNGDEYTRLEGSISVEEARALDLELHTSGEATGGSRWSQLCTDN